MKPSTDTNRLMGSSIPFRLYHIIPPERRALEKDRVDILFRVLISNEDIGPEAQKDFFTLAMEWARAWPAIPTACQELGAVFIKKWFLTDNPTLLPLLLDGYLHYAVVEEGGAEAATLRIESLACDPTPLGRPTDREGRKYYAQAQDHRRERLQSQGWERVDMAALWRFAEAWVIVRHKLIPSLPAFIIGQPLRQYQKKDLEFWQTMGEDADFSSRLRTWRRELQNFDKALQYREWGAIQH